MDAAGLVTAAAGTVPQPARRVGAGMVRLGGRDVAGLRGIVARWRRAGYAQPRAGSALVRRSAG
jgi:hypothetical protein